MNAYIVNLKSYDSDSYFLIHEDIKTWMEENLFDDKVKKFQLPQDIIDKQFSLWPQEDGNEQISNIFIPSYTNYSRIEQFLNFISPSMKKVSLGLLDNTAKEDFVIADFEEYIVRDV